MNITEYLTAEQDKWHRRFNDAEIEIDRLKRENESYKMAIHRLIMERDMAIRDINIVLTYDMDCHVCAYNSCCRAEEIEKKCGKWRGVRR